MKKKIPELTPFQKKVIFEDATEPPFDNEYWNNHKEGIYVDAVDGTPLFASYDKFDSGTGWPSFVRPIQDGLLVKLDDYSLPRHRVEVRTKTSDIHLGHVFEDGPKKEGGLRYCINSAALRFIPKEELEQEGYQDYWKKK
ncbi:MAG: peptide-methionine (R)-S-oxide reductase MsrB [Bacilli bacterium]|jgi:methionine-R-sulfoxide reductase|nr:peptide-methionine (R)-S-oxide reductase MsrB [Bacilli bacterium]